MYSKFKPTNGMEIGEKYLFEQGKTYASRIHGDKVDMVYKVARRTRCYVWLESIKVDGTVLNDNPLRYKINDYGRQEWVFPFDTAGFVEAVNVIPDEMCKTDAVAQEVE